MRIVIVGRFHTEALGLHISDTLNAMGHDVFHVDPSADVRLSPISLPKKLIPSSVLKVRELAIREMIASPRYEQSLVSAVLKACDSSCDLIISTHDFLSPRVLTRLKDILGTKVVLWFPDHIARFGRAMMMCGEYDYLFFKDPFIVQRLTDEIGLRGVRYLPECFRSDLHTLPQDEDVPEETIDIGTAGNLHPSRVGTLQRIAQCKYSLVVWGPDPPKWIRQKLKGIETRGFVANHDKARAFRSCRIVLNTIFPAEVYGVNVRTFEAAASGAFQICTSRDELSNLFRKNEIVTYSSLDELIDKIDYFMPRFEERREIAEHARMRALSEHTYKHRLQTLLEIVGGTKDGIGDE